MGSMPELLPVEVKPKRPDWGRGGIYVGSLPLIEREGGGTGKRWPKGLGGPNMGRNTQDRISMRTGWDEKPRPLVHEGNRKEQEKVHRHRGSVRAIMKNRGKRE